MNVNRIDNPLTLIPLEDLETIVDRFYERTIGLEDVVQRETLFKGAQLVRDPYDYYTPGLTQSEENAILAEGKEEKAHWFMPPEGLHVTILATACAAITQYVPFSPPFKRKLTLGS